MSWLERQELLVGSAACEKLRESRVVIIGLGGVGGPATEALCRTGIGHMLLIDHDTIAESNLNRQIFATRDKIGCKKAAVARERLLSINPDMQVDIADVFLTGENLHMIDDYRPDYIVDCQDTISTKMKLARHCQDTGRKLIACMGTGNRLDGNQFYIGQLAETVDSGDSVSRICRKLRRKYGVREMEVLYSRAAVKLPDVKFAPDSSHGRHSPGSVSFVPPVAGYLLAGHVANRLIEGCI